MQKATKDFWCGRVLIAIPLRLEVLSMKRSRSMTFCKD